MTTIILTAFCAGHCCCPSSSHGLTASGMRPIAGLTIAAPRSIPFGTRVHIEGIGWRTVQDRTARRIDGWDLYVTSHRAAKRFGRREVSVIQLR